MRGDTNERENLDVLMHRRCGSFLTGFSLTGCHSSFNALLVDLTRQLARNTNKGYKARPKTKEEIKQILEDKLSKGYGVMLSNYGHLVRVQSVNSQGIIVDDPYGKLDILEKIDGSADHNKGYRDSQDNIPDDRNKEGDLKGKDNLWSWDDVVDMGISSIEWYYPIE